MTELLYYQDAYLKEFDARVIEVEAGENSLRLVLDCTAFYPGGGGQPNDMGWLNINGDPLCRDQGEA